VGDVVRDKDGISAALALLSLAATRAEGQSLLDRWDALEAEHGVHLTTQVTLHAPSPAGIMGRLRAAPPAALAGQPVTGCEDLAAGSDGADPAAGAGAAGAGAAQAGAAQAGPAGAGADGAARAREPGLPPADVLIYRLPGARVVIRPSGTEPKLKAYLEVVEPATPQTLATARMAAAERLGPLRAAVTDLVAEG
jgi:phosphomannomutase